jgi:serine/threonine-protein kinase RsbW
MKTSAARTVKLDVASRFEMLEMVQTILARVADMAGFDEDAAHYLSVAVRESVINAIKHGNRGDENKRVAIVLSAQPDGLEVRVQDQGAGFDPDAVPDPLADENLLKTDGRGIFFMKKFMDEVTYSFPPRGGTVVRMTKRLQPASGH